MAETPPLERLTASDLFLLMWDDYGWSTDIGGLAVLDGVRLLDRDGRVRIDAVRGHLEPRLHLVPRFRQLLYRPRLGLGWPLWVDAPTLDLADHIRVHSVAPPGGQAQLLAACQDLAARRLDPARPLWELWLLPGLPHQRVGAYLRLHHAVADGAAALARPRGPAGPSPRRACPGRTTVHARASPRSQPAAGRQPVPPPGRTRPRVVRPNPPGQNDPSGATGPARVARGSHRAARPPHQPQPSRRHRPPPSYHPRRPERHQADRPRPRRHG